MQKGFLLLLLLLLPFLEVPAPTLSDGEKAVIYDSETTCEQLYEEMQLGGIVGYLAFQQAFEGYKKIDKKNKEIMTLIDFTRPSTEKRMYVFDMKDRKMLFNSVVAHGRNSGQNYATSFSNVNGSYKSSLGFYLTEATYQGKNGYSLVLEGLEKGINDRAKERAIVMHGAAYANPSITSTAGRLGRSLGCPALPLSVTKPIINTIKGGSILFIYANNKEYLAKSSILSGHQTGFITQNR